MTKNNSWVMWLIAVVAIVALVLAIVALTNAGVTGNPVFSFGGGKSSVTPSQNSQGSNLIRANSCDSDSICEVKSLLVENNITSNNITVGNLTAKNITSINITVWNLNATNITTGNLTAGNITSINLTVTDLYITGQPLGSSGYLCISSTGKVYRSTSSC